MSTKAGVERLFSTYSMVRSAIVGGYEGVRRRLWTSREPAARHLQEDLVKLVRYEPRWYRP